MGVIDMVNGRLCETLTIEEIEQIRIESYNQALDDLKFNLEKEKKTYARNGQSLDTDKWLDELFEQLGL